MIEDKIEIRVESLSLRKRTGFKIKGDFRLGLRMSFLG